MCYITATELKNNLMKYMILSHEEDVYVTKNGKVITVLTSPDNQALKSFLSLKGCLSQYDDAESYENTIGKAIEKHGVSR